MSQSSVVSVISEPDSSARSDLFSDEASTAQAYHTLMTQNITMGQGLHGCRESSSDNKWDSDGNVRPTLQVHGRTVSAHVLAMAYRRIEAGQGDWDNSLHVRHLCRNSKCVRQEHLVLETPEADGALNARRRCQLLCCAGCSAAFNTCKHRPKCLLAPTRVLCHACEAVFEFD